jgi:hypothetical protein
MVRPRTLSEFDKLRHLPAQGVHWPRYYSPSTKVPRTKAVICVQGAFWTQRIITDFRR